MKNRIIALALALVTLSSLAACNLGGKDNDNTKGDDNTVVNLSLYVAASGELVNISSAVYAFFMYDLVGQYSYYLSWYGYDTSKSLKEQTSKCAFDEDKTWFEYFDSLTKTTVEQCVAFVSAAKAAGMSLSEEELADLDKYMAEAEEEAYKQGYDGIEGLIAEYYVEGINANEFRACMELQQLAYNYVEKLIDEIDNVSYTSDDLNKVVINNKDSFFGIDYVHYSFFASYDKDATDEEKATAYAEAKNKAQSFLDAHNDVEAFKNAIVALENEGENTPYDANVILADYIEEHETYTPASNETDADQAFHEWAYAADRKPGDTYIREQEYSDGDKYYTVIYITKPTYIEDYITKNVRHIFFEVSSDLKGDELQAAAKEAYAKAEEVYNTYKSGELTEEAFAALAVKHSQDSNAAKGGIYENVALGAMVIEFENWIYDSDRAIGDTEIIQTEYGYHIMYFVGDGLRVWEVEALNMYKDELYEMKTEELIKKYPINFLQDSIDVIP